MTFARLAAFLSSLRLTVVLLLASMILVLAGTIGQVQLGLYGAQRVFFRSFVVLWSPSAGTSIPVFPGGYLIGGALFLNLVFAHLARFRWQWEKVGIWMAHLGIVLLLGGFLATDLFSMEGVVHVREGKTAAYAQSSREIELALVHAGGDQEEPARTLASLPESRLARGATLAGSGLDFSLRVERYETNAATVAAIAPEGELGTWLVSSRDPSPPAFERKGKAYRLELRPRRLALPAPLSLIRFTHTLYPGTDIPREFSSLVRLRNPATGEDREVLISMNRPLRYEGFAFYQSSYDADDHGSVIAAVRNPNWATPYVACVLVFLGLATQFLIRLLPLLRGRRTS